MQQLNTLLNGLLQNEEKLPYSFFVEEQELATSLGEHLHKNKVHIHSRSISLWPCSANQLLLLSKLGNNPEC